MKPDIGVFHRRYDSVCSFGQWCATSILLRKCGLRSASGPFDWLGPGTSVSGYVDLILSGFEGFLQKEKLRHVGDNPSAGHAYYFDDGIGQELRHDFAIDAPFEEEYVRVLAKYRRRIERMNELLAGGGRILFVHYRGQGHYAADELVPAMERLRAAFPRSTLDLLVLECDGSAREPAFDEPGPGIARAVGDFYDRGRFDAVLGNERLVMKVLRGIGMRGKWRNLLRMRMIEWRKKLLRSGRRRK